MTDTPIATDEQIAEAERLLEKIFDYDNERTKRRNWAVALAPKLREIIARLRAAEAALGTARTELKGRRQLIAKLSSELAESHYITAETSYCVHMEAELQHLPAAEAANAWRPIETAPRDGTPVDLWVELKHFHTGKIHHERKCGIVWGHKYFGSEPVGDPCWVIHSPYNEARPTHWMPLPLPPAQGDN